MATTEPPTTAAPVVDASNPAVVNFDFSGGKIINEKKTRCGNFQNGKYGHIHYSYTENSPKEELVLEHVIQYQKQFNFAYSTSRKLFLYPPNECDIYKFICTTIRPQKMGYLELYDYNKAVRFISNFIQYEELDNPDEYPEVIPSPANVMKWQKGDCFDMSILLTSILIGSGYDAYVVFGTASRVITTKNESFMDYEGMETEGLDGLEEDGKTVEVTNKVSEFQLNKKEAIISKYDKRKEEEKTAHEEEERRKAITIDDEQPEKLYKDPYEGQRKHAWVLLKKGRRGVEKDVFLEPSTGRMYDIDCEYYYTVDSVFNNRNFWVNLKPDIVAKEVSFENMDASTQWEYVMLDTLAFGTFVEDGEEAEGEEAGNPRIQLTDEEKRLQEIQQVLDMPPSWSPKIILEYEAYHRGSLLGETCQFYAKCKVEIFAEYSQVDGLVKRITIYQDFRRLKVREIRYLFKHRKDKLKVRRRFPFEFKTVEYYDPNIPHNWKKITEIDRKSREIIFYKNRNEDGLIRRLEMIGEKTMEWYEDRDDRVVYRSIRFEKGHEIKNGYKLKDHHSGKELSITKLTQKFEQNPILRPSEQPERMVVNIKKNYVKVFYHMEEGQIAPVVVEYPRDQIQTHAKLNEGEKKVHDVKKQLEYKKVHDLEKEGINKMRDQEEIADKEKTKKKELEDKINLYRKNNTLEDANKEVLEKTLQDKARERKYAANKKDEKTDSDAAFKDPLYPYLAKRGWQNETKLNLNQALEIKNEVMSKLKERIMSRAEIIQQRIDEEHKNLAMKQNEVTKRMQSKPEHERSQQEKDFDEQIEKINFRITILQQRASKFEVKALEDYQRMDQEINKDNRFEVLLMKK